MICEAGNAGPARSEGTESSNIVEAGDVALASGFEGRAESKMIETKG